MDNRTGALRVGFCIIFQTDGLQLDDIKSDLESRGCEITGVSEDYVELLDGTDVTTIFLMADFGNYINVKLAYNLREDMVHKYHFWPMESITELSKTYA